MKNRLVIFLTKYPDPGKVKTRLAKRVGNLNAVKIQKKFIKEILNNNYHIKNDYYDFKVCLDSIEKTKQFISEFKIKNSDIFSVNKGDLGEVMSNIFNYGLLKYREVILIGSDIPKLSENDFTNAFNVLENNDFVLGPANDGGYYLIGMKKENNFLFENIEFSTETVLEETVEKIKIKNLSYGLLGEQMDIDTYEDLLLASKNDKTLFFQKMLEEIKNLKKQNYE